MLTLAAALLTLLQGVLLFCLVYQVLLAFASARQASLPPANSSRRTRFAIAIPAHNEATVLSATLAQLQRQDYPPELYDVHVVADHCTDDTFEVAVTGGAIAYRRDSSPRGRKAYAIQWLLERILASNPPYDAIAIFDADSLVDPDFLQSMDSHLAAGEKVLQGQHIISNPGDSFISSLAAVDMRLNNRLRNQSRRNLNLSCRLMGDAMVFDAGVLRDHGWLGDSLTEDREYGYELLLKGLRVHYVPQARSYGQATSSWKQAEPQRLRWYRGLIAMQRRLALRLLANAVRSRSFLRLDGALELLLPSFSFLAAASIVNLFLTIGTTLFIPSAGGLLGVSGAALLLFSWISYPLLGLIIDRAPGWAYRALLFGPLYLLWRLWISVLVRLRGDRVAWIRTQRREEIDQETP